MTEAEAREAGFELADYEDDEPVQIWEENIESVNLFISVQTQWRTGFSGPTGLDYTAVLATLEHSHRRTGAKRKAELFADVQVMESAALKEMAKKS